MHGVQSVGGALIIGRFAPDAYTEADLETGQRIVKIIGPLVEHIVLLHKERHRQRRLAVLPEVAHVVGTSPNAGEIFAQLGAAVRTVLDFDMMIARLLGPSGAFEGPVLPARGAPVRRSAGRLIIWRADSRRRARHHLRGPTELDPGRRGDRLALERGVRSIMAVPLIFGERVERVLVFAKSQPNWFDKGDGEIARGVALHVVVAIQHQRLAEEQRRLAVVDRRICRVTLEHSGLLQRPPS